MFRDWNSSSFLDTFYDTLNYDLCKSGMWLRRRRDTGQESWTLKTITNHKNCVSFTEEKVLGAILTRLKEKNILSYCEDQKSPFDFKVVPFARYSFSRYTNPKKDSEYVDAMNLKRGEYILFTKKEVGNFTVQKEDVLKSKIICFLDANPNLFKKLKFEINSST